MPLRDTIESVSTTDPPAAISGRAFCTVNKVPFTLTPKYLSKWASMTSPSGTNAPPPALAKTTSRRPNSARIVS